MKDRKINAKTVWKVLFKSLIRHCTYCGKTFNCSYTCEPHDKTVGNSRKLSSTFCYCPKCWVSQIERGIYKHGEARELCHLIKKYKRSRGILPPTPGSPRKRKKHVK